MNYIKQFDSVRAFAVFIVILSHWAPKEIVTIRAIGGIGVDIFFVLSGFLITRILLSQKTILEEDKLKSSKLLSIGKFMIRRSLRIFPIYYLTIIVLYFGVKLLPNPISTDWKYYVLYMQNFKYYFTQSYPGGKVFHFWSLAVEEQFYLIWPWILFYINKKYIRVLMLSGIILGTLSSLFFPLIPGKEILSPVLTICCLQAFCLGGLLAYWSLKGNIVIENNYTKLKLYAIVASVSFFSIKFFIPNFIYVDRLLIATISTFILASILLNKLKKFKLILENRALIFIGKISYGIYIYHNFIPVSLYAIFHLLKKQSFFSTELLSYINFAQNNFIVFNVLCFLILIVIAYTSFKFIETPFLKLKNYF